MINGRKCAENEARRWIARMASAEMSADELAAFKQWRASDPLHDRAFTQQRGLWRAAGHRPAPRPLPFPRPQRRRWLPRRRAAVARAAAVLVASLLLAMLFGPNLWLATRADHRAGVAVESLTLPDGSRAMLDAGAAIAIAYDGHERRIELLRGGAWFEVAPADQRPFRVAAMGGMTQDIATAFEVRRGADAITIGVTDGMVDVHAGHSLRLRTSERARYGADGAVQRLPAIPADSIAAWRQGEILLDHVSVREAVAQVRRYRRAPVYLLGEPDAARQISGVFRTDQPDQALDVIASVGGLSVRRVGSVMLLQPAG